MRNHRRLVRASRKSWEHMVPANTLNLLYVPVKRTVWTLEIGTVTLTMACQTRPVTPAAFREDSAAADLFRAQIKF
jgi:hypothetical protein